MDLLSVAYQYCALGLLTLLAAALFLYTSRLFRSAEDKKCEVKTPPPPEPAGAWPVVGHLPLLGVKQIAAPMLGRMADEYGPVFMLRVGVHRALVVSSHEAAKECFTACDRDFASRPGNAAAKYLGYDRTMFALAPYGPHCREMKKLATVELLSSARLVQLRHIRASEINTRMRELYEVWAVGGRPKVEMKQWFADTMFNVLARMVVGRRYLGAVAAGDATNVGGDDARIRRFQKSMTDSTYLNGLSVPSDAFPCLEWLDLYGYIKAMKRTAEDLDAVMANWIEEHREKARSGSSRKAEGGQDFIDVMLSTVANVHLPGLDPDTSIKSTALAIFIGGVETAEITMTWVLALLLNHPRVLEKVREELDLHVGTARNVEEEDMGNLAYLRAVFKETMRLYPAGHFLLPREATADCRVGGYHVPAGTRLLTNLWKLHRDPRVWEEPLEFRPERFLGPGDAAKVDGRGQHFVYLPFGSGRRMCPGIALALQVMQLTLARLVHGFDLATPDGEAVDMAEGRGVTVHKAGPLDVLFTPRLPRHLYYCI